MDSFPWLQFENCNDSLSGVQGLAAPIMGVSVSESSLTSCSRWKWWLVKQLCSCYFEFWHWRTDSPKTQLFRKIFELVVAVVRSTKPSKNEIALRSMVLRWSIDSIRFRFLNGSGIYPDRWWNGKGQLSSLERMLIYMQMQRHRWWANQRNGILSGLSFPAITASGINVNDRSSKHWTRLSVRDSRSLPELMYTRQKWYENEEVSGAGRTAITLWHITWKCLHFR